jgi:hypothetical protein
MVFSSACGKPLLMVALVLGKLFSALQQGTAKSSIAMRTRITLTA